MDTVIQYAGYALTGLGAVVVALTAIAPVTSNQWDNKLLDGLRWIERLLHTVIPSKPAPKAPVVVAESPKTQPKGKGL